MARSVASPNSESGGKDCACVTEDDDAEWEHPCPFRGEPTMTPAGKACSACGLRESHINDDAACVAEVSRG
jgi:hypothetical protein